MDRATQTQNNTKPLDSVTRLAAIGSALYLLYKKPGMSSGSGATVGGSGSGPAMPPLSQPAVLVFKKAEECNHVNLNGFTVYGTNVSGSLFSSDLGNGIIVLSNKSVLVNGQASRDLVEITDEDGRPVEIIKAIRTTHDCLDRVVGTTIKLQTSGASTEPHRAVVYHNEYRYLTGEVNDYATFNDYVGPFTRLVPDNLNDHSMINLILKNHAKGFAVGPVDTNAAAVVPSNILKIEENVCSTFLVIKMKAGKLLKLVHRPQIVADA
jgi:hypothetical protein